MENSIYGLIGISIKNNISNTRLKTFSNCTKTDYDNNLVANPFILQECYINEWLKNDEKVFDLNMFLKEYNTFINSNNDTLIGYLFTFIDILNFGNYAIYRIINKLSTNINIPFPNIQGIVNFSSGLNRYNDSKMYIEPLYDTNKNTNTLPKCEKYILDEAHFIYNLSIIPQRYRKYTNEFFGGYSEKDFEKFKYSSLTFTNFSINDTSDCKNEFALFIKVKDQYSYIVELECLNNSIKVYKNNNYIIYDCREIDAILSKLSIKIDEIELYYDPKLTLVLGLNNLEYCHRFNIKTKENLN